MQALFRWTILACGCLLLAAGPAAAQQKGTKYARFAYKDKVYYGIVEGDQVRVIDGDLFGTWKPSEARLPLDSVTLLVPSKPRQVLALAGNYRSHLGEEVPEKFKIPQPFYKSISSLAPHGADVVIPPGTETVHYEAELVIVIGKQAENVSPDKALDYVLGVTCGNDISARDWQKNDVQWWRAKGSATFGPCGPVILSGVDYDNLKMVLRLNGEVKQETNTSEMIHNVANTVSFISRHLTLYPGDLIFTGTPGETSDIKPGDVMEVEIEGVGILRNGVKAAQASAE